MNHPASWCDVSKKFCHCEDRCEDEAVVREQTEDERLDDPRHGQAEELNRLYGR